MIDRVQQNLERLAPELDDYKRRKIFTAKEISKIVDMRRVFETRISSSVKRMHDYLEYIEYEKKLLKLRNRRIIKQNAIHSENDVLLYRNILAIYRKALFRFPEPYIVKEFADYCVKRKFLDEMKETLAELCLKSTKDSDLWIFCAQKLWEAGDIDSARNVFIKAFAINDSIRLYIEFFRLEVLYAEKINAINKEIGIEEGDKGDVEEGEVALLVLQEFCSRLKENEKNKILEIAAVIPGLKEKIITLIDKIKGV
ncbi:U3 small nucleolar RNA-associated protein 6 [Enteropsectra breve]|nr:U3 small nucleolar RNA-associated protein 6 [Enteropsectra breve]